jgi:anti-sigma B factor antagonist
VTATADPPPRLPIGLTCAGSDGDIAVVTVHGDADASQAPELQRVVDRAAGSAREIVVDLSAATLVDSATLGVLMRVARRLRPRGGDVHIVVACEPIRRLFELTLLDRLFPLHASLDEALAAFGAVVTALEHRVERGPAGGLGSASPLLRSRPEG